MGAILNLVERNLHEVHVDADRMLFHIPSSSLFASDELTGTIIDTLRGPGCSSEDLIQRLAARFNGEEITETLRELMSLELVSDGSPLTPDIGTKRVERTAINTVVQPELHLLLQGRPGQAVGRQEDGRRNGGGVGGNAAARIPG